MKELSPLSKSFIEAFAKANCGTWNGNPVNMTPAEAYKNIVEMAYRLKLKRKTIRYKIEEDFYAKGKASFDPSEWINTYPDHPKQELDFNKIPTSFYQKIG